jgi:hypothetical protein
MSLESQKELDDFFRSMRQAYNSRDIKLYRSHFWTDKRFAHLDPSGRTDLGWGAYEEILDQEFRYMDTVRLELKDLKIQVFDDQFGTAVGDWRTTQVDPEGREVAQSGRCTFSVARVKDDWKIVQQHYSIDAAEG